MARRAMVLGAVGLCSLCMAAVPAAAGGAPIAAQDPIIIGIGDDYTGCATAAVDGVVAALLDVENVEEAKDVVVLVVSAPQSVDLQRVAAGFTLEDYLAQAGRVAAEAWFVEHGTFDCPPDAQVGAGAKQLFDRHSVRGGWVRTDVTNVDQLRALAHDRFGKPAGGRSPLLLVLLLVIVAAVAAAITALVYRSRASVGAAPDGLLQPLPPSPLPPLPAPPPPSVPSLGVSRDAQWSGPNATGDKMLPRKRERGTDDDVATALKPIVTLDGLVGARTSKDSALIGSRRHGSSAVWAYRRAGLDCTAIYTEQRSELGEDAEPSIVIVPRRRAVLLGVYDGLGGAGSAVVETAGGLTYNEAFVASRVVREEVEAWFANGVEAQRPDDRSLHARITERLAAVAATHLPRSTSGVTSNMARTLPTTLALTVLRNTDSGLSIDALWAGDSRAFLLTPTAGLQQLTADHVRNADVLHQLVNDSPMANMVSASRSFELSSAHHDLRAPVVVLCATDGVFGYVRTPGEVEHILLDTLTTSSDPASWGEQLVDRIVGYTADDATLSLAAVGFRDFAAVRSAFAARAAYVASDQQLPFADVRPGDHEALSAVRTETWERYQAGYTALIPRRDQAKAR